MKAFRLVFLAVIFTLLLPTLGKAAEASDPAKEILVKYRFEPQVRLVRSGTEETYSELVGKYAFDPTIEYIEPNSGYEAALTPNDTYFGSQWSLDITDAPLAWDVTTGDDEIVIAIVDSGVQIDHPDLASNIWVNTGEVANNGIDDDLNGYIDDRNGWDFVEDTESPEPKFQDGWTATGIHHGTVVAGIAAAVGNNAKGIAGVAYGATIMPIRVLDHTGHGSTLTVAEGVQYAMENGADIINLSFVGNTQSTTLASAISEARANGILVVASAGNDGVDLDASPRYPVCDDDVIGVAATDSNDQKTSFSNYGSCIDISAPGINIYGTIVYDASQGLTQYYQSGWYGTSAAAPLIAGALGLAKSHNPLQTPNNLELLLGETAHAISPVNPTFANDLGAGRVDLAALLQNTQLSVVPGSIVVSREAGGSPLVRTYTGDGELTSSFYGFAETFFGGVHIASADLSGDGSKEIIVGAGNGGAPHVRMFSTAGSLVGSFFAYDPSFRGGVNVASADLDGNGTDELLAGAGNGGAPHIRIFNNQGQVIGFFYAYDPSFRGGVHVAAGDLDGTGEDEIVAGAGVGGAPHIRIFNKKGVLVGTFYAFAETFRGGVNVAAGDVDGDGKDEIITGAGPGGAPHVRIFTDHAELVGQFFAYATGFRGGVNVAAADVDGDGTDEIITGAGPGGGPQVRVFTADGTVVSQFFAFDATERTGITVGGL